MDWSDAPQPPPKPKADVPLHIELTTEQRRIVKEKTGRDMHFVEVDDSSGHRTRHMHGTSQDDVTKLALRNAEQLNEYDEAHQQYLEDLAKWQDEQENDEDPAEEARADAEAIAAAITEFYMAENAAIEAAREAAIEAWDPDGKKREKMDEDDWS